MTVISLLSDKPMKKDASCINIRTCDHYLKSVLSEVPYHKLFSGFIGNRKFFVTDEDTGRLISVTHDYLLESGNWISNDLLNRVYQNTISILDDPDAVYNAGKNIFKTTVGTQVFLLRLAGVQTIINRLPKENAKFNANRSIKIIENQATVGSFGSGQRSEYSAMGMQVNLASRLETACEAGGILISHSTWALINDQVDCRSKETIEAKGFSRPVRAYEVNLEIETERDAATSSA